jgi:DNA polymerase-4
LEEERSVYYIPHSGIRIHNEQMSRCIFHIDLDAFFVSVEQILNPKLQGKPVIVGGQPDRRGVVASASYEARAYGIHSAMPLARAYKLCPGAIFLQGSFSRYREFSDKFMDILSRFSPDLEPGGLDEAYLDCTGCDIYGTPYQMATELKRCVKDELGIIASVGISSCKVVSKIASDLGKPDGLVEVPQGDEKAFLAPLPVNRLPGVGKKTEEKLLSLGITTIGQLAELTPEFVKTYIGSFGIMLHRHANGIDNRKIEMRSEVKSISRETTFSQDTFDHRILKGVLSTLCERVGANLRSHDKQARTVSIKLRYENFETLTRSYSTEESVSTDEALFSVASKLLALALSGTKKRVRLIGVEVSNLIGEGRQLYLFDAREERQERLDRAVDKIRKKYGFSSVQTGRALALKELFESGNNTFLPDTRSPSH